LIRDISLSASQLSNVGVDQPLIWQRACNRFQYIQPPEKSKGFQIIRSPYDMNLGSALRRQHNASEHKSIFAPATTSAAGFACQDVCDGIIGLLSAGAAHSRLPLELVVTSSPVLGWVFIGK
jgi:hypothetical protein